MSRLDKILKVLGLVDVHVHLRDPGASYKEDFTTGTMAAVAGGYTQILDMPNNTPPTVTPQALNQKINLAKGRIWCDLGFNFGATAASSKYFKKVRGKAFGLKVYMGKTTGPLLVESEKDVELIFKSWTSSLPIMIHANDEKIELAINIAKKYKKAIHICHVTADQIKSIEQARKEGLSITCEVTPHHLFLTQSDVAKLGPLAMMKPPLLTKRGQKKLWDSLDKIDMIATDHAPHTLEEKLDKSSPKFGVPGLETTIPLMINAVNEGLLSVSRLIEMTATNPRRTFHLQDQSDTYVLIDTRSTYKISEMKLFTKCQWTPFKSLQGRGKIKAVSIRGKIVFKNGKFFGKPEGKIIAPES